LPTTEEKKGTGPFSNEAISPEYEPPDIVWEESIPKVTYGLTCARRPGESQTCNQKPSSKIA
jgi:hypothetical protein